MLDADVTVDRRDFPVRVALRVADGERVALFGPSGAGKTTVLEAVAGLVTLRIGRVEVAGRVLDVYRPAGGRRTAVAAPGRAAAPGSWPVPAPVGAGQPAVRAVRPVGRPGLPRPGAGHRRAARRDAGPAVRRAAAPGRAGPPAARALRCAAARRAVRQPGRDAAADAHRPGGPPRGRAGHPVGPGHPPARGRAGVRRPAGGHRPRAGAPGRRTRRGGTAARRPPGRRARRLPGLRAGRRPARRQPWWRACTRTG